MLELILIFFVGLIGSFLSGLSGGGVGLIVMPFMILIGVPPQSAVATIKASALGLGAGSIARFLKTDYIVWKYAFRLIPLALLASFLGAKVLFAIPEDMIELIVTLVLIFSVILMYLKKNLGIEKVSASKLSQFFGYLGYLISETLRASFGSGFGFVTGVVLIKFLGLDMLSATATKRIPGIILTIVSFGIYFSAGIIDIYYAIALFLGALLGSYAGSHIAIAKGNKFVKTIFTAIVIAMIVSLLIR